MVLGLCQRFGCLPSQLYAEQSDLLYLLNVESLGTPEPREPEGGLTFEPY